MQDTTMSKPVNYTREAFMHPLNLGFLIAAFTTSFFLAGMQPAMAIVMSVTFAIELIYLGTVPQTAKFQKHVNLRKFKERNSRFDERQIFGELSEEAQKKFLVLKHIAGLIRENFAKLPYQSHGILDSINTRIDSLITSYMLLLDGNQRYDLYLKNSVEESLNDDIESVKKEIEQAASDKHKSVLKRRLSILEKRLKKYAIARDKHAISVSQLQTIEDTIKYIYEKSMTMTNLEEIEHQMDSLLLDLDDTDSIFDEINHDLNQIPDYLRGLQDIESDTIETQEYLRSKKEKTN